MPGRADPDRARLRQAWEAVFGVPPPAYASVAFLRLALEHEAQVKRHGGLPVATRRALRKIAEGKPVREARGSLRAGAHLVREWNGRSYQVEVLERGFRLDARIYPSLSAIARHITGTTWSGPRFFGLTNRGGGKG
ncbi:DUF2924 domain-containing protein [Defluviimonas sp. WL0024]|uniref:DUF2924 domain-containing protein n=2 Tax=Albidovulum TaxID=205889 RepID=A0ABT3J641_9RHOB|nr:MULTISPECIES: DUF2924 domain-containing protein [Defluviimonas]MCU9849534.1 DUF2924 domain-containing protein [Defluviimonas sp. WL0024]MCW3783133.1 DUF2924 domain-containing protein [Defluviimonas salinarum]